MRHLIDGSLDPFHLSNVRSGAVYENPLICPTLSSSAIEWEQSIVEGHPTHPVRLASHGHLFLILTLTDQMHRARHPVPPLLPQDPQSRDWNYPRIRFAIVSRARLEIQGPFEQEAREIVELASRVSGRPPPQRDGCVIVPVYDLQVENIRAKFPDVEILDKDFSVSAFGQASIRYVYPF